MIGFGIIGAGLIGNKRATAIHQCGDKVVAVTDIHADRAASLAQTAQAQVAPTWEALLQNPDIDAVIVATTNDVAPKATIAALQAGKHVLVEKPAGRNPKDLISILAASHQSKPILRVGFNHRFHPGLQKAKRWIAEDAIGPIMYFRARYGHGGRIGYDKEWRADPAVGGGGELLDQGVHIIDLCRWLGGEFRLEYGQVDTFFWDMPVEDNGFLFLRSPDRTKAAWLHASCTEWKNLFDFEIFGRRGKLQIFGLGRSYGVEELRYFRMKPEMGPPEVQTFSYPGEDMSWHLETDAFLREIRGEKTDLGNAEDALRAVEIVHDAYRLSKASWIEKEPSV